jgi:hypothetical protein
VCAVFACGADWLCVRLQVQELEQADREGFESDTQEQLQDLVSRWCNSYIPVLECLSLTAEPCDSLRKLPSSTVCVLYWAGAAH